MHTSPSSTTGGFIDELCVSPFLHYYFLSFIVYVRALPLYPFYICGNVFICFPKPLLSFVFLYLFMGFHAFRNWLYRFYYHLIFSVLPLYLLICLLPPLMLKSPLPYKKIALFNSNLFRNWLAECTDINLLVPFILQSAYRRYSPSKDNSKIYNNTKSYRYNLLWKWN